MIDPSLKTGTYTKMAAALGMTHYWSRQRSYFTSAGDAATRVWLCNSDESLILLMNLQPTFIVVNFKTKVSDELLGGKMDSTLDPPGRLWVEMWAFCSVHPQPQKKVRFNL